MATHLPTPAEIVACLKEVGKPLHAGGIAKRLQVPKHDFDALLDQLRTLEDKGQIDSAGRNRFRSAKARAESGRRGGPRRESWQGVLTVSARGFGFVAAADKTDVYVPGPAMGGALHGDTVEVEVQRQTPKGLEGAVVAVVSRGKARVAGVLHRKRGSCWLEPDDDRIRGPIVLDPAGEGQNGEAAVVEITRYPDYLNENPEGRIVRVLGVNGDPQVEIQKIKVREQIEEEHPVQAMREAEAIALLARKLSPKHRKDLREIPFLTIDPADARDHDDSVSAERTATGFRVYVAIADVAEYVQPGTALNDEARLRGCTIYLPDRAIPMLPGSLAADLCSLLPERERYCMCCVVDLDPNGVVKRATVVEGIMRAAALITYDSAARTLGFTDKPPLSPQAEAFKKQLKVLAAVSAKLRRARFKRGALNLDLPEAKLDLDPTTGEPIGVHQRAQDPGIKKGYEIVEELMLLANEAVARWLIKKKSPAVYRVHGTPDEEKLLRLAKVAEALGMKVDPDTLLEPKELTKWLKKIDKHPRKPILEMLLLRSLKQATYQTENIGHFGLASDAYVHFTSPIRRYPDLLVHRAIKGILRGGTPDRSPEALEALGESATLASTRERAAIKVEREVVDLYRALYMRSRVGELFEATVTAIVGGGLFAAIADPFVDVMVRFESLGKDRYELSDDQLSLVGQRSGERISLGDKLILRIEDVSILRRQVYGQRFGVSASAQAAHEVDELDNDELMGVQSPVRDGKVPLLPKSAFGNPRARGKKTGKRSPAPARGATAPGRGRTTKKAGPARGKASKGAAPARRDKGPAKGGKASKKPNKKRTR